MVPKGRELNFLGTSSKTATAQMLPWLCQEAWATSRDARFCNENTEVSESV